LLTNIFIIGLEFEFSSDDDDNEEEGKNLEAEEAEEDDDNDEDEESPQITEKYTKLHSVLTFNRSPFNAQIISTDLEKTRFVSESCISSERNQSFMKFPMISDSVRKSLRSQNTEISN